MSKTRTLSFFQLSKIVENRHNEKIRRLSYENAEKTAQVFQEHEDLRALLPKLEEGLDVNVKFTGNQYFEYTQEQELFDAFDISCYHCWRVDPQSDIHDFIKGYSYNEIVDRLMSDPPGDATEDELAKIAHRDSLFRNFIDTTASQITAFGVSELHEVLKVNSCAVLFRNNHFSTVYRSPKDKQIYILVTDIGIIAEEPSIIWTSLNTLAGDETFLDNNFISLTRKRRIQEQARENQSDEILARQIQQKLNLEARDEEIARRMQQNLNSEKREPYRDPTLYRNRKKKKKKNDCIIS